ncbi:MAG: hypothetical protein WCK32_01840 [Chlorobiaceae bacterium]
MKKNLFSGVVFFVFLLTVFASNWVRLSSSNGENMLVDTQTIHYEEDYSKEDVYKGEETATYWIRCDYEKPHYVVEHKKTFLL